MAQAIRIRRRAHERTWNDPAPQSRLSLSTYVFSEGMENWTPASQVDAISSGGAGFA